MPYYDYKCKKCNNDFEKFRSMSDTSDIVCPECNNTDTEKIVSPCAIAFKGEGFYENDYKVKTCVTNQETI